MENLDQVSLQDLYGRLGRLEQKQIEAISHIGKLTAQVQALCASLDGPSHLKERVSRLEAWRNRLVGMFLVLSFLVAVAGALSALVALVR